MAVGSGVPGSMTMRGTGEFAITVMLPSVGAGEWAATRGLMMDEKIGYIDIDQCLKVGHYLRKASFTSHKTS